MQRPLTGMRVVLVDDSIILRDGLAQVLQSHGVKVVGSASDATTALVEVLHKTPHAVVLDMRMPPTHTDEGLQVAQVIHRRHPDIGILILAQDADGALVERLLDEIPSGVGYLLKDNVSNWEQFTDAMVRVANGGTAVDPQVVDLLLKRRNAGGVDDALSSLTPREHTVLALLAQGCTNVGMGDRLHLSARTVETHVRSVFSKLGLEARAGEDRRVHAAIAYLRATEA